ncbi:MAG: class I SAM-dependent methyltransferase [Anaerolineae bacterium]|nr:class I SAM-dependent methyltransferase [Anaerolineae bacterium]
MTSESNLIVDGISLDLAYLQKLQQRPALFAPGEALFWDDPYISEQMLTAHLDPKSDAASRRPQIIDREVSWLIIQLQLDEGSTLLDLGSGPGLYSSRFAQRGLDVTGVDYSERSLAHAQDYAQEHGLDIDYILQDYLALDFKAKFDAVVLINGDFCVLSPERRSRLLQNIHRALKPGGRLALDVFTRRHREHYRVPNQWYVAEKGFWRGGKHVVLGEGFDYPSRDVLLNQYIIIDADGTTTVYRNWFQNYTAPSITAELEADGYSIQHLGGNLRGGELTEDSEWIGVVATKAE